MLWLDDGRSGRRSSVRVGSVRRDRRRVVLVRPEPHLPREHCLVYSISADPSTLLALGIVVGVHRVQRRVRIQDVFTRQSGGIYLVKRYRDAAVRIDQSFVGSEFARGVVDRYLGRERRLFCRNCCPITTGQRRRSRLECSDDGIEIDSHGVTLAPFSVPQFRRRGRCRPGGFVALWGTAPRSPLPISGGLLLCDSTGPWTVAGHGSAAVVRPCR